ncbi:MAG: lysoplasmalogenase family protein [Pelagimonas sp.]|uniref:lysoplasmalogenase family protein n=1 Tax=Pelagimonas sp. TaxID=2073170 RepID=UPI003D6BA556
MADPAAMQPIEQVLAAISVVSAVAYPFLSGTSWHRSGAKTCAVGALAVWAAWLGFPWVAIALVLSAMGDLALSRPGDKAFLIGMVSFGLAHLTYVALFAAHVTPQVLGATNPRVLLMLAILGLGSVLGRAYARNAGALAVPVRAYVVIIVVMGLMALLLPASAGGSMATLGALLFIGSDAILGQEQFLKKHWRGQGIAIWGLYYLAQAALMIGLIWLQRA